MTSSPSSNTVSDINMNRFFRALGAIERAGNMLPHPFWLFWILAGILGLASTVLSWIGVTVILPSTGESVAVKNLFSLEGLKFAAESALDNFAEFPPLSVIIVVLLGVVIAERSGLLSALLRVTVVRLPNRWLTFAIAFSSMVAHIMSDSAYLVMIPLGASAFLAAGRSPMLGLMVAYVSTAVGFNASPLVTPADAIRSSLAATAAKIVDPNYVVTPVATYFFTAASSVFLSVVIALVVDLVLAKRPDFTHNPTQNELSTATEGSTPALGHELLAEDGSSIGLTATERRALKIIAGVLVLYVVAVAALLLPGSPLLGKNGSIVQSVVVVNISVFIALLFAILGMVYGRRTGTITSLSSVPAVMVDGVKSITPVIVLFFAVSQFLAYFKWTGIGNVITVEGAELLRSLQAPHLIIILTIIVAISLLNMVITSGAAMWSILAPVIVPMMMYVNLAPEAAMAAFMIGDSVTNCVTPMNAYFVLALGFMQQYRKNAGIGTLLSFTVPVASTVLVAWSTFFVVWYSLGIPLGPGVNIK